MSMALTDNPAVTDPHKHLTPSQRTALLAIDHYRHQRRDKAEVVVGRHRFKASTIASLESMQLIRCGGSGYAPTLGGSLAVSRLKGERP